MISFSCFVFTGCDYFFGPYTKNAQAFSASLDVASTKIAADTSNTNFSFHQSLPVIGEIELRIINSGLIDVKTLDSSIVVDLKYSTTDNFLGMDVYGEFDKCYLQKDVAEKLKKASSLLQSKFPYYRIIVFDAVRPRSIQAQMWDTIKIPLEKRSQYLTNPVNGSLHNFGAAVDVSIIDEHEILLDMGTSYDYFGELAYPRKEELMRQQGKLSYKQLFNRKLLREVMETSGFFVATTEWWHFNSCQREEAFANYKMVE